MKRDASYDKRSRGLRMDAETVLTAGSRSEFLATMSHELRTPLGAIIGLSEALKDGLVGELSETQQEHIGDIFASGQHLLSLINDIIDLSKVEAGVMALELDAADVGRLLSDSLSIMSEKAAARHMRFELQAGADLGILELDTSKTKQIVYTLLSNAVKLSANGDCVTLSARRVPRREVGRLPGAWPMHSLPLAQNDYAEFLEVCVSDTGVGLSREDISKLFLPFSHSNSGLARKFDATGLGLVMVKQLAELHGGTVAVASAEGEGSRFAAWMPWRPTAQAASTPGRVAPVAVAPVKPKERERVALVIEDNDKSADVLRLFLEAEGFTVLRALSAEDALQLAPKQPLALITLDLQLYGMNGWQFLLQMRDTPALAKVPVIVISGRPVNDLALSRGAAASLLKPFSRGKLQDVLADLGLQRGAK
jgi:signal transduction histidine kinase